MVRCATLLVPALLAAAYGDYESVQRKFGLIESHRLARGTRVELTARELNAWVERQAPLLAPGGVRNPHVTLGQATAEGSALVDFGKLRRAQGYRPGWLMARLLDGEREVRVAARIRSAGGQATVDVERVEISGVVLDGPALQFIIQNFVVPMYPNAAVGQPFELGHRIERLEVQTVAVGVVIGR
jgi:hypothetical protein